MKYILFSICYASIFNYKTVVPVLSVISNSKGSSHPPCPYLLAHHHYWREEQSSVWLRRTILRFGLHMVRVKRGKRKFS